MLNTFRAGVYDILLQEYLADPAPAPSLSASIAHVLLTRTPAHAWLKHPHLNPLAEQEQASRLDKGTIGHALLLEDDSSRIVPIEAEDYRTKAAREARDEAWAGGKLPILEADLLSVQVMVEKAKQAIAASEFAEDWRHGTPEQTLLWQANGIWKRSRPDKRATDWRICWDYKTVTRSASPELWARSHILQHGYDLQAALVMEAVGFLMDTTCTVVFVVQEMDPPFAVSFVSLSPSWLALAQQKLAVASDTWKRCLERNEWPAYSRRVAYVEPPNWATYAMMEGNHDYVSESD